MVCSSLFSDIEFQYDSLALRPRAVVWQSLYFDVVPTRVPPSFRAPLHRPIRNGQLQEGGLVHL